MPTKKLIRVHREAVSEHGRIVGYLEHRDYVTVPDAPVTAAKPTPTTTAQPTPTISRGRVQGYTRPENATTTAQPTPTISRAAVPATALLTFDAPNVLGGVVARQRAIVQGVPLDNSPTPVQARRVVAAERHATFAPVTTTLDGVLAFQRSRGLRAPDPLARSLTTMNAQAVCGRCGREASAACGCPPPPRSVLEAAVERRQAQEAAMQAHRDTYGL